MRKDAAHIRSLTNRPFAINLFVEPKPEPIDTGALRAAHERLRPYYDELGLALPAQPPLPPDHFAGQIEALLQIKPTAFSFTFGIPQPDILNAVRSAGIYTIGTATTVEEAAALEAAGVDAVCAQGAEAGGHRGTFLGDPRQALIGTLALVPQVVDAVNVPVIAAGGITDGRGLAAVLALGAVAAQCGTAFLRAHEAGTSAPYRAALENARDDETLLTTAFSGRLARGIRNRFSIEMDDPQKRAPYPYQNALTRDLRTKAAQAGNAEFLSLWAGQAFSLARAGAAAQIVRQMLDDALKASEGAVKVLAGE
jgi:nitronate monooxygenase